MEKFIVYRRLSGGQESSYGFETPAQVANFLAGVDPRNYHVYVKVTELDYTNVNNMQSQLTDVMLEAAVTSL